MGTNNKILNMFNIQTIKKAIANCPKDEIVILCGNWSINQPRYEGENPEIIDWDFYELEQLLNTNILVSDYDDLIADPHGIMSN